MRISSYAIVFAVTFAAVSLSACHMISGAGQDLSATGQAISNTAKKTAQ
jgi:predicted small secreted protein